MKFLTKLVMFGISLVVGGCILSPPPPPPPSPPPEALRLVGSNTIGSVLAPELLKGFAEQRHLKVVRDAPGAPPEDRILAMADATGEVRLHVSVAAHGTLTAFSALLSGQAQIGMASRPVRDDEVAKMEAAGLGNPRANETVVALDGVLVLVPKTSGVSSLTLAQIEGLFTCHISNWRELGGPDLKVRLYARDDKSGTTDTFRTLALHGADICPSAKRFESSEMLSAGVAADPAGIGYVGFAYAGNAKPLSIGLSCGLEFPPEQFLVRTEEYPLSRRLFLYTPEIKPETVQRFLMYARSDAVAIARSPTTQPIIEAAGFINQLPEIASPTASASRAQALGRSLPQDVRAEAQPQIAEYSAMLAHANRLSTTFYFGFNRSDVDPKRVDDVDRLVAWARAHPDRHLILVGHASNPGSYQANLTLSRIRADDVAHLLVEKGLPSPRVMGVSTISAVACDDAQDSGAKNRRVEVWVQ